MSNGELGVYTTKISATSRASIKIKDSFYTTEFSEEKLIPQTDTIDDKTLQQIRDELWNTVNAEVDNQIEELINTINGR